MAFNSVHFKEQNLASMRTLAGELAAALRNASHMIDKKGTLRTQILKEAKIALAKAKKMGVTNEDE